MPDPWPMIEPYFMHALNGRWVYARIIAFFPRGVELVVNTNDESGEGTEREVWGLAFARGRLRAYVAPDASGLAGPTPQKTKTTGQWGPMLTGTLHKTYGPAPGVPSTSPLASVGGNEIQLGIFHGFDGVTTTTIDFPNGHNMTMKAADGGVSFPGADQDVYFPWVDEPSPREHANIYLNEGLLRFIRSEIPGPLGRPDLPSTTLERPG